MVYHYSTSVFSTKKKAEEHAKSYYPDKYKTKITKTAAGYLLVVDKR